MTNAHGRTGKPKEEEDEAQNENVQETNKVLPVSPPAATAESVDPEPSLLEAKLPAIINSVSSPKELPTQDESTPSQTNGPYLTLQ